MFRHFIIFVYLSPSRPSDLRCDGRLVASEARDGRHAPPAAATPAPRCCCLRRRAAAHAAAGSPERDLPGVPLQDRTGDCAGHRHSDYGDIPDHTSYTGTGNQTVS